MHTRFSFDRRKANRYATIISYGQTVQHLVWLISACELWHWRSLHYHVSGQTQKEISSEWCKAGLAENKQKVDREWPNILIRINERLKTCKLLGSYAPDNSVMMGVGAWCGGADDPEQPIPVQEQTVKILRWMPGFNLSSGATFSPV